MRRTLVRLTAKSGCGESFEVDSALNAWEAAEEIMHRFGKEPWFDFGCPLTVTRNGLVLQVWPVELIAWRQQQQQQTVKPTAKVIALRSASTEPPCGNHSA